MKTTKTGFVILLVVILSACNFPQTASTPGAPAWQIAPAPNTAL
jgi:hypothetical protein